MFVLKNNVKFVAIFLHKMVLCHNYPACKMVYFSHKSAITCKTSQKDKVLFVICLYNKFLIN